MVPSCSNSNGVHGKAIKSDRKMYLCAVSESHELKNCDGVYSMRITLGFSVILRYLDFMDP